MASPEIVPSGPAPALVLAGMNGGLLLPDVVIGLIAEIYVKDFWGVKFPRALKTGEKPAPLHKIIPLLTVSKHVSAIILPLLYRSVILRSKCQLGGFLAEANIKSYVHVKALFLGFRDGAGTCPMHEGVEVGERMFRSRLKGITEGEKECGWLDSVDGKSVVERFKPKGVVIGMSGARSVMPSVFDLFGCESVNLYNGAMLHFPSDTPPANKHRLKRVTVHAAAAYEPWGVLLEPFPSSAPSTLAPYWSRYVDELNYVLTFKVPFSKWEDVHEERLMDLQSFLRYTARLYVHPPTILDPLTMLMKPNKNAGKARHYPKVVIRHKTKPHLFCVGQGEEARRDLGWHPKITLTCCDEICGVTKSDAEIEVDRLFRGDLGRESIPLPPLPPIDHAFATLFEAMVAPLVIGGLGAAGPELDDAAAGVAGSQTGGAQGQAQAGGAVGATGPTGAETQSGAPVQAPLGASTHGGAPPAISPEGNQATGPEAAPAGLIGVTPGPFVNATMPPHAVAGEGSRAAGFETGRSQTPGSGGRTSGVPATTSISATAHIAPGSAAASTESPASTVSPSQGLRSYARVLGSRLNTSL